jgi:hypothetical protein
VLPPDEGSHRKADLSNRSSQEKGALFETAHPAAAGPYSRPDESGFWEGCGLSKPKTDYCRAFRGALQKGSTYEDLTARSILLRCPNVFERIAEPLPAELRVQPESLRRMAARAER